MEAVYFVAKKLNFKSKKVGLIICSIILFCFDVVFIAIKYWGTGVNDPGLRYAITQFVNHCLMWTILFAWIYAAPRFQMGFDNLEFYLYEFFGIDKGYSFGIKEVRRLWSKQQNYARVFPKKNEPLHVWSLKIVYILLWITLTFSSAIYLPVIKLKHIKCDCLGCITILLALLTMSLCMFSWWACMEYGFFLSRVSNQNIVFPRINLFYGNIYINGKETLCSVTEETGLPQYHFNPYRPSQTRVLSNFLFDSSMTSVCFLLVSGCYTAQYLITMLLQGADMTNIWEWIWMLLVILPGIVSLLPVVILPKLFLIRIHRRWKRTLIKDYQRILNDLYSQRRFDCEKKIIQPNDGSEYWAELINNVSKDRLDFRTVEIVITILSFILNLGAIVITIVS